VPPPALGGEDSPGILKGRPMWPAMWPSILIRRPARRRLLPGDSRTMPPRFSHGEIVRIAARAGIELDRHQ